MAYIRSRNIVRDAGIEPGKLNLCLVERFLTPVVGATDGATAGQMTILGYTDASSGSLSVTQGDFTAQSPDVPRGLEIFLTGGATTWVTGGNVVVRYYDANGAGPKTKAITGLTLGGSTQTKKYSFGAGVSRLYSADFTVAGTTLTGLEVGIAPGAKLAVSNDCTKASRVVHEAGQDTPPTLDTDTGLFTPGTTLDGSTDVEIRVHYGTPR